MAAKAPRYGPQGELIENQQIISVGAAATLTHLHRGAKIVMTAAATVTLPKAGNCPGVWFDFDPNGFALTLQRADTDTILPNTGQAAAATWVSQDRAGTAFPVGTWIRVHTAQQVRDVLPKVTATNAPFLGNATTTTVWYVKVFRNDGTLYTETIEPIDAAGNVSINTQATSTGNTVVGATAGTGALQIAGGVRQQGVRNLTSADSPYAIVAADAGRIINLNSAGGACNVTIAAAQYSNGEEYWFRWSAGGNNSTVTLGGAHGRGLIIENQAGEASIIFNGSFNTITFVTANVAVGETCCLKGTSATSVEVFCHTVAAGAITHTQV